MESALRCLRGGKGGVFSRVMETKRILIQAGALLIVVWAVVIGVRSMAESKIATADGIAQMLVEYDFENWSGGLPDGKATNARHPQLLEVADHFNRLDFNERQRARERRIGEDFFRSLAPGEREYFVELTLAKSMQSFIRAIDGMSPDDRRRFVEDGLREIERGRTADEMQEIRELSDQMLARITEEGMRAYFQEAGAETKLDLAPLMEVMDGVMKGIGGNPFNPQP